MIAIVTSCSAELNALTGLGHSRDWPILKCNSVQAATKVLSRNRIKVIIVRHKLDDGYSDDVIALANGKKASERPKTIVLLSAGTPSSIEVRQLALGADCVQRDPVRSDVVVAYVAKYIAMIFPTSTKRKEPESLVIFGDARFDPVQRTVDHKGRRASITPREALLLELLTDSSGRVVTYDTLYSEVLGRRFLGETSNMRVLLGKLSASMRAVDIPFRSLVDVIPKMGYRYNAK